MDIAALQALLVEVERLHQDDSRISLNRARDVLRPILRHEEPADSEDRTSHHRVLCHAHFLLACNYFRSEEHAEVQRALDSNPHAQLMRPAWQQEAHFMMGVILMRRHELEAAKHRFLLAEMIPENADIHRACLLNLAHLSSSLQDADDAVRFYTAALSENFDVRSALQFIESVLNLQDVSYSETVLDVIQKTKSTLLASGKFESDTDRETFAKLSLSEGFCIVRLLHEKRDHFGEPQFIRLMRRSFDALSFARAAFPLNGFVSTHVRCVRALCGWYKLVISPELAVSLGVTDRFQSSMDLMAPIVPQLTAVAYRDLRRQLMFDMAKLYEEWFKSAGRAEFAMRAVDLFGEFIAAFDEQVDDVSSMAYARLCRASMMLNLSNSGNRARAWKELCLEEHIALDVFATINATALEEDFLAEIDLCRTVILPMLRVTVHLPPPPALPISSLSHDVLLRVFSFLPTVDLLHASMVSVPWNAVAMHNSLWKRLLALSNPGMLKPSEFVVGNVVEADDRIKHWYELYKLYEVRRREVHRLMQEGMNDANALEERLRAEREAQRLLTDLRLTMRRSLRNTPSRGPS